MDFGAHAVVGTWSLVAARAWTDSASDEAPYGEAPRGLLAYTAAGRVVAMISHGHRELLSGDRISAPVGERANAFASFFAYGGRFDVVDGRVVHHVEVASVENWVGTDLVRLMAFDGSRLTLRTPPLAVGGEMRVTELYWERIEP